MSRKGAPVPFSLAHFLGAINPNRAKKDIFCEKQTRKTQLCRIKDHQRLMSKSSEKSLAIQTASELKIFYAMINESYPGPFYEVVDSDS
ncbi:hypothetical protein VU11_02560 [Desulfobulbus sp. US2]|nr:hypothetical protein [Desulfobulbus sp. US2]